MFGRRARSLKCRMKCLDANQEMFIGLAQTERPSFYLTKIKIKSTHNWAAFTASSQVKTHQIHNSKYAKHTSCQLYERDIHTYIYSVIFMYLSLNTLHCNI